MRRPRIGAAALALVALSAAHPAASAEGEPLEYAVKAAYLYKFGDFIEWPERAFAAPASAVNLCVAGEIPFDEDLAAAVEGKRIGARPIVVRRLGTVTADAGCHILYVGGADPARVAAALDAVRGTNVLTVADVAVGGGTPSIIRFEVKDNHLRFDIDQHAASLNGLTISSKLLSLALNVTPRK